MSIKDAITLLKEASGSGNVGNQQAKGSTKTTQTVTNPAGTVVRMSQSLKDSTILHGADDNAYDFFQYKGDNKKYGNTHTLGTEKRSAIPINMKKDGLKMPSLKNIISEFIKKQN